MQRTGGNSDRLASLDLLRVVAALAVVAFHYLFRGAAGDPMLDVAYPALAPFALAGYLGVNLFFLISGFVIAWSAEGRDGVNFAIARFARIYPGFVASMTITFVVLLWAGDPRCRDRAWKPSSTSSSAVPALQRFQCGVKMASSR